MRILQFLVSWLAFQNQNQLQNLPQYPDPGKLDAISTELLHTREQDFQPFLPQIIRILLDHNVDTPQHMADMIEHVLMTKCASSVPFGLRVCWLLQGAASDAPEPSVFGYQLSKPVRQSRATQILQRMEEATFHGYNMPSTIAALREEYAKDMEFFTKTLSQLSFGLRRYPVALRAIELRKGLDQFNALLYSRMLNGGKISENIPEYRYSANEAAVVRECPFVAKYSIHYPLTERHREGTSKILRVCVDECEVLPSKERCPYLLNLEVLRTPLELNSHHVYTDGHTIGVAVQDVILQRIPLPGHVGYAVARRGTFGGLFPPQLRGGHRYDISRPMNSTNIEYSTTEPFSGARSQDVLQHDASRRFYELVARDGAQVADESFEKRKIRVQRASPFGHLDGWDLKSVIVKAGDDLRKEMLAMQMVELFQRIFDENNLGIKLQPYEIISTGNQCGLVECLLDAASVDGIKKKAIRSGHTNTCTSLSALFEQRYGPAYAPLHQRAVDRFVRSLAGYSLLTYVLQVKDRHNGNIMLGSDGSIIHIDFGFILGESPGWGMNWESAPFKLTMEYVDLMQGLDSVHWRTFEQLFVTGFYTLRERVDELCAMVQLFYGASSKRGRSAADGLRARLEFPRSEMDVRSLIIDSLDSWRTRSYDFYQQQHNGILQ